MVSHHSDSCRSTCLELLPRLSIDITRAADCTSSNIAHIIFLTTDVSFSKALGKALPDRVFRQISLGDCSPEVARRFVMSHLESNDAPSASGPHLFKSSEDEKQESKKPVSYDVADLDRSLEHLGGRCKYQNISGRPSKI